VDLFFVLSGYLIGGIILDHRRATNFVKVFYLRRTLRIVPIYYVLLVCYVVASICGLPEKLPAMKPLFGPGPPVWTYFTFTQNFVMAHNGGFGPMGLGVTWSLAVEEQFYLALPLVVFLVPRDRLLPVLAGLIAAALLVRFALYDLPPRSGWSGFVLMPTRADALLLGVLAAWLMRREVARRLLAARLWLLYLGLGVTTAGIVVLHQRRIDLLSLGMSTVGTTWVAVFYGCLLLAALHEKRGIVTFVTRNRALGCLGKISYSVYLFHNPIYALTHALLLNQAPLLRRPIDALVSVLGLGAVVGFAALSWHFFEKPLVDFGHGFQYESRPEPGLSGSAAESGGPADHSV
jgi:peptidoglycan/LPS O-acetylase OafA/YrhL